MDGASEFGFVEWSAIGLGLSTLVLVVVLARINLRMRAAERAEASELSARLVDLAFIDQLAAAAPAESVAELFSAMSQDCRACIAEIREAAKVSEFDRMQDECKALADSCEAFGAVGLGGHARALDRALTERNFEEAGRLMVDIGRVADDTFRSITRELKTAGKPRAAA